jgi:hypothetical protein
MSVAATARRRCALLGVLGTLFLVVGLVVATGVAAAAPTPAGYVDAVSGEVTATNPGLGRRVLGLEDKIYAADAIATGAGSAVRIVFLDKSVLEIKESSQVDLASFSFEEKGEKAMTVKFAVGVFRMITGEIVKANPEGFRVESPLSVIGIRGTEFASRVGGGSELHALFSAGTPILVASGGREQRLDRPDYGVDVRQGAIGAPRPLTEEEKRMFARVAFTRQMDMNRLRLLLQSNRPMGGMRVRP